MSTVATTWRSAGGWTVPSLHRESTTETRSGVRSEAELRPGEVADLTKFVVYQTSRDGAGHRELPAPGTSFESIAASSRAAWAKRWRASDVHVGGDPEAELAFRFAAFQLIGAAPPRDTGASIGARLMSGFGYRHHVFWDTDIFIAPYFSVTQPDLARNHLGYRYRGLAGARRKAAKYGRAGAFYAWESAGTGDEVTPEWSTPMYGDPVRIWTGEIEEHITADVAWSADHYHRWTGDDAFMEGEGAEMIVEGARYWASRLTEEPDGLHIRNVIGPDEYHIHVDDNFYTNAFAAWHLRRAAEVARWLSEHSASARSGLGLDDDEVARFEDLAKRVVIRRRPDGVWEQHQGFFDLEEVDLNRFEPRVHAVYDLLGEERMQRTAVIKQADVLMAMALLPEDTDKTNSAFENWRYYEPKADHGSSLSLAFHALLACQMDDPDLGYRLFRRAAAIDLEDAMGNGADGIHAACQGGILQTGHFGFGGLHLSPHGEPQTVGRLPSHWETFGFSFLHRGEVRDVEITR